MSQSGNSLQAALIDAALSSTETAEVAKPAKPARKKRTPAGQGRAVSAAKTSKKKTAAVVQQQGPVTGRYRDSTVMVGGHFPPHVLRQLRMIAAEEDTTNQALIAEALDLLFVKKGKSKITELGRQMPAIAADQ